MLPVEMHPSSSSSSTTTSSSSSSSSSSSYHVIHHPEPNWLAFSLSNNHNNDAAPTAFSLFRLPFNPTPEEEPPPPHPSSASTPRLSIISGSSPNFPGVVPLSATPHFPPPEIYDASDLMTITPSFLQGFSGDVSRGHEFQPEPQRQQELQLLASEGQQKQQETGKKAANTFGQRTSIYHGVTRHRWTGRYEAHLWDNSSRREGQSRKGRQVYLGGYDKEDKAARAYDLAALKYWGPTTTTNFPVSHYEREIEEMKHITRQEFVASLRRKSSGFSRGASMYRGVTRHHQHGRWQARIGRVAGNKDLYLGTFTTQEEAAEAYDIAAIKFRGLNAVTNFDMSRYDIKSIMSCNLPIGGLSSKSKNSSVPMASENSRSVARGGRSDDHDHVSCASSLSFSSHLHSQPRNPALSALSFSIPIKADPLDCWPVLGYNNCHNQGFNSCNGSFPSTSAMYENNPSNCFDFNGGVVYGQQQQHGDGDGVSIPYATAGAVTNLGLKGVEEGGGGGTSHDADSRSSWTMMGTPSSTPQSFQTGKENRGMFQTPIFGWSEVNVIRSSV